MSSPLILETPAKINLSFEVKHKREDGFHEIETLMARLKLFDTLEIHSARGLSLEVEGADIPADENNLVLKAVKAFSEKRGKGVRKKLVLKKRIPSGAGLGGGSSDAAATLIGLNMVYETNYAIEELAEIGASIGSDVPFFIYNQACWCRGRGEIIEPTHIPDLGTVVLLKPSFSVSTPKAFQRWQGSKELKGASREIQKANGLSLRNDLERPVFEQFLFLPVLKNWLLEQDGVNAALMSGSGSTLFALVDDQKTGESVAQAAKAKLDPTLWSWVGGLQ